VEYILQFLFQSPFLRYPSLLIFGRLCLLVRLIRKRPSLRKRKPPSS
jgi:hypothetical protein